MALEPDESGTVLFEVIRMPDSAGFGDYTEAGMVIPALLHGQAVNFTAQMYLDDEAPIAGGLHFIADLTLPYGRVLYDYRKGG